MIKIFTQNDLLRYIYDEMEDVESREMQNALLFDVELADAYLEFESIKDQTESLDFSPSEKTIENILDYSRNHNSHTV